MIQQWSFGFQRQLGNAWLAEVNYVGTRSTHLDTLSDFNQPLIVTQAAVSKAFFDAIGGAKEADGLMTPIQLGSFGEEAGGDTAKLYKELKAAMPTQVVYFATFGYDVGLITAEAVKNSDGTREGLRAALEKIKDLPGVNGPISFTPQDHTGQNFRSIGIGKLVNGVSVPAD